MAKGDNTLLYVLFLAGAIFFIYRRHSAQADDQAPPAATGAHRYRQTVLPEHNYVAPPPTHATPVIIPPSGGYGAPGSYYAHHGCNSCGSSVRTWDDMDDDAEMYAVPWSHSYGDVGSFD